MTQQGFIIGYKVSAANLSHVTYLQQELIMASIILGLIVQKYGIQLEKTLSSPVCKHSKKNSRGNL